MRAIVLLQQAINDITASANQDAKHDDRMIDNPLSPSDISRVNELLEKLLGHIEQSNQLAPTEKAQVSGEIRAGIELLKLPKLDLGALEKYLVRPLRWLGAKFFDALISRAAESAVGLICKLLGL